MTKNDDGVSSGEWVLLNNLDQATIALQSLVSLSSVLCDVNDAWRYSSTYEDALTAFTAYLDKCVEHVSVCKEDLFKNYRSRKGIPEIDYNGWWGPATATIEPPGAKKDTKKAAKKATKKPSRPKTK